MRNTIMLAGTCLLGLSLCGVGCSKDVPYDTSHIRTEPANRSAVTHMPLTPDMEAAKTLTPPIKAAISADKTLTGTKIDVSSGRNDVTISGHVSTQAQKDQARQDAQKVLTDMKASQKLINDLEVIPG